MMNAAIFKTLLVLALLLVLLVVLLVAPGINFTMTRTIETNTGYKETRHYQVEIDKQGMHSENNNE